MTFKKGISESLIYFIHQREKYAPKAFGHDWLLADPLSSFILPFLHLAVSSTGLSFSDQASQRLKSGYILSVMHRAWLESQLAPLLEGLHQANLDVIPLKGAILQDTLYKSFGVRGMGDFDILVRTIDFPTVIQMLQQCGLVPRSTSELAKAQNLHLIDPKDWPCELSFAGEQGLMVDLHHQLVTTAWFRPAYSVSMDEVWQRSVTFSGPFADGLPWRCRLSPYDELAYLCLHLGLHGLQLFKSYLDIDLFLRHLPDGWDWQKFLSVVKSWHTRSCTYHVFKFTRAFFDTPVPREILQDVKPGVLVRAWLSCLTSPQRLIAGKPSLGSKYPTLVKVALFDSFGRLITTIACVLFPREILKRKPFQLRDLIHHWAHIRQVIARGD